MTRNVYSRLGARTVYAGGWLLIAMAIGLCVWAQYDVFDGKMTCGGQPMSPGDECIDLTGDGPALTYQQMYDAVEATVGYRMIFRAGVPGTIGAIGLFYACWRVISVNRFTPGRALKTTLLFATVPLLAVAVVVHVLSARIGDPWSARMSLFGLTPAVMTVIVALAGAGIMTFAAHEAITARKVRANYTFDDPKAGLTPQEREEARLRRAQIEREQQARRQAHAEQQAKAEAEKQAVEEREAKLKALRKVPLELTDPTSDLWIARRAEVSEEPPPAWQVHLQRVVGALGLGCLVIALMTTGWLACGLAVGGLILVSSRAGSRAPTANTALLWGAAAALALGVTAMQLLPPQPLSWSTLITGGLLGWGAFYKVQGVSYASEDTRVSHVWWNLSDVVLVVAGVPLVLCATISGTAEAVVAYVIGLGGMWAAFPSQDKFPPPWRAFRFSQLGLMLAASVVIAVVGDTPTTWIAGGFLALAVVVSAVSKPKTADAVDTVAS